MQIWRQNIGKTSPHPPQPPKSKETKQTFKLKNKNIRLEEVASYFIEDR